MGATKPLAERHNWTRGDVLCLRCRDVREYDVRDAGMSIVRRLGLLPPDVVRKLEALPKRERAVAVGRIQAERREVGLAMTEEFVRLRSRFFELNGVDESEVLCVKKDAVFLLDRPARNLEHDGYVWREKGRYTSYVNLLGVEAYYSSRTDELTVKGIGERARELCAGGFLADLRKLVRLYETQPYDRAVRSLSSYRRRYLSRELPLESYREVGPEASFRLLWRPPGGGRAYVDEADGPDAVDVTYNYVRFLVPLIGLVV